MKTFLLIAVLALAAAPVRAAEPGCVTSTCHAGIVAFKHPHQPAAGGECLNCHKQTQKEHPLKGGKSFTLALQGAELCRECHTVPGTKKVVHDPVKGGECVSCHAPHGADTPKLLKDVKGEDSLCFACHDKGPFARKTVHGPVAEGSCDACHDPHESDNKGLLKKVGRELCLSCHEDFGKKMRTATVVHPPVQKEPCTSCHDPHSSDAGSLLKQSMPELCVKCHKDIGKKLATVKVPHKPVGEGKLCGNCHTAHFSQSKGLLSAVDEKTACLACHSTSKLGNPPLSDIAKELEGKRNLHGPIASGRCSGCHDPHGSDHPRILKGNYSTDFYVPFRLDSYGLCLSCHDKNLLQFQKTTIYTKFRNGDRNLHYLHVSGPKGRSCRACHEPHASTGKKLIGTEGVKFGQWRVKSRFELTATGGSCAPGCHRRLSYDRNTFDKGSKAQ
ncbi:MAG: cytochrome C [Geobacter sp.]|nr:MAG: cytochrome C [Geobacter sp.]